MNLLPKIQMLSRLNPLRNKSISAVLSGINPSNSGEKHLWKKMISNKNLEQAFDWLCQKTTSASAHSDVWDFRRQWQEGKPYEQGASKQRIGLYLARWLGGATLLITISGHAYLPHVISTGYDTYLHDKEGYCETRAPLSNSNCMASFSASDDNVSTDRGYIRAGYDPSNSPNNCYIQPYIGASFAVSTTAGTMDSASYYNFKLSFPCGSDATAGYIRAKDNTGAYYTLSSSSQDTTYKFGTIDGLNPWQACDATDNFDNSTGCSRPIKAEPTNHASGFTATTNSTSQITTTWTDAAGAVLPDGYLIICSDTNITIPEDGIPQADDTDCSDGTGIQNIAPGTQTATWSGLPSKTQYTYMIFSYSNTATDIDYKTDGTPPLANASTEGVPDAPATVTATPGNTQATVDFSAASDEYGTITGYTVTSDPAGGTDSAPGSMVIPRTMTGLTNGTAYTFTVVATNASGDSLPSAPSNSVTPAALPDAPTNVAATAGNAQATVTFDAPSNNGGSAITGYTVTSSPAGGFDSNAGSTGLSHTITGLSNGTAYTFTVVATNAIGPGPASAASNSVTPSTVPDAPTNANATAGNTQATVTFDAPSNNGGSAITGYTVTSNPAGGVDSNAGSTGLSHTVTGLSNGTAYTFTVVATNASGSGSASAASNSVTPSTVPDAPTSATATAGNAQATVAFDAPSNNGGSAITGYTVTSNPAGGVDSNAGSTGLSHTITGLSNGTAYIFTVVATNANGPGSASAASNSVIPSAALPGAPTNANATAGNTQATVTFDAPDDDGGSAITGYTVTSDPAGGVDSNAGSTDLSHTITGLINGTAYTFTVVATNAKGAGSASAASNSVTPSTVPDAPTNASATAGNTQATVTFDAPDNGGSAITGYTVTSIPAGGVDSNAGSTGLSHTITGLSNGTAYTFTVVATNASGSGSASAASNSVTPSAALPGAPTNANATAGNTQATVTFDAPDDDGGSPITGYTVTSDPAGGVDSNAGSTDLSHTITGLINGTAYTFTVVATNANGSSSASAASNSVTPSALPSSATPIPSLSTWSLLLLTSLLGVLGFKARNKE